MYRNINFFIYLCREVEQLVARNGRILLSSEVYKTKQGAEKLANKLSSSLRITLV